jgi:hypothetical protein
MAILPPYAAPLTVLVLTVPLIPVADIEDVLPEGG